LTSPRPSAGKNWFNAVGLFLIQLMFFFSCFGFRVSSGVTVRANMELAQIYPFHGESQELFLVASVVLRSYTQGMTLTTP
jgi:hypothetical protein